MFTQHKYSLKPTGNLVNMIIMTSILACMLIFHIVHVTFSYN